MNTIIVIINKIWIRLKCQCNLSKTVLLTDYCESRWLLQILDLVSFIDEYKRTSS